MNEADFTNLLYVAQLRFIQAVHEKDELKNPDRLVGRFIPMLQRWRCAWLSQSKVDALRSDPFYYYLIARTRYYDTVFLDAISDDVQFIINVGCGTDTRAYRFARVLRQRGVKVLECDQPQAISEKRKITKRKSAIDRIDYLPIDLNDEKWPEFEEWMIKNKTSKGLILMEGVSPYVNADTFTRFLKFLAGELSVGSRVAYDFKIRGVCDDFGFVGRTKNPFRLPANRNEVAGYHEEMGLRLNYMEQSSDLSASLVSKLACDKHQLFTEDCLVKVEVVR